MQGTTKTAAYRFLSAIARNNKRTYATQSSAVVYRNYGYPSKVLAVEKIPVADPKNGQVLVEMLAAPINVSDINMIEGVYGRKADFSSGFQVAGGEGAGVVVQAGPQSKLSVGQVVIPGRSHAFGTWQTHVVCNDSDVIPVPKNIPAEYAAVLSVNPSTAFRLLEDFVSLKPGDVIIQNGATSVVAQCVTQLAKERGLRTINILRERPRPEMDEVVERIKLLGGDIVVSEEYAKSAQMSRLVSDLPQPRLAINMVGGESSLTLARMLGNGGTMVTIGGMSRKPVTVPTSSLIFKDITLKGFWLSKWLEQASPEAKQQMISHLATMVDNKKLVLFLEKHKFSSFDAALAKAQQSFRSRKVVLSMK